MNITFFNKPPKRQERQEKKEEDFTNHLDSLYNDLIDKYNGVVGERNKLSDQYNQLKDSFNTLVNKISPSRNITFITCLNSELSVVEATTTSQNADLLNTNIETLRH